MLSKFKSYIPDKKFLKHYVKIIFPIIVQQILINSAIVIDNLMVGKLGQDQVIAIGAVNAIHFFFMFAMYGITSGSGIYLSQFNGAKQKESMIKTAGVKQLLLFIYSLFTIAIIWMLSPIMIKAFIKDVPKNQNAISLSINYYKIFVISILFKAQNFGFSTTFQEIGQSKKGVYASTVSVLTNIIMNFILIFGFGPIPAFGIVGAAYGTLISKIASFVTWNFFINTSKVMKNIFCVIFKVNREFLKKIFKKTLPLFIAEVFWSLAIVMKFQIFSSYGEDAFTAMIIQNNVDTFISVIWAGLWGGTVYLLGKKLGSNNLSHAKERAHKLIGTTFGLSILVSIIIIVISIPMLKIYNVAPSIIKTAWSLIIVIAFAYPIRLMTGAYFFIIRTSGMSITTMKIDLFSAWLIMIPILIIIQKFSFFGIFGVFLIAEFTNIPKLFHAYYHFRKYKWLKSLIN